MYKEIIGKAGLPLRVFAHHVKCRVHDPDPKEHIKTVIEVDSVMRSRMSYVALPYIILSGLTQCLPQHEAHPSTPLHSTVISSDCGISV
jgi:hypothetical protein